MRPSSCIFTLAHINYNVRRNLHCTVLYSTLQRGARIVISILILADVPRIMQRCTSAYGRKPYVNYG